MTVEGVLAVVIVILLWILVISHVFAGEYCYRKGHEHSADDAIKANPPNSYQVEILRARHRAEVNKKIKQGRGNSDVSPL